MPAPAVCKESFATENQPAEMSSDMEVSVSGSTAPPRTVGTAEAKLSADAVSGKEEKKKSTGTKRARKQTPEPHEQLAEAPVEVVDNVEASSHNQLIVAKSIRAFLKSRPVQYNCSADVLPTLNRVLTEILVRACQRADANNHRKTLMSQDI